jgi:hypothetical protein
LDNNSAGTRLRSLGEASTLRAISARAFCFLLCRRSASKAAKPKDETEISEIDAAPLSKELKKRWSYFIRKVYETDPLACPKCQGEMRIISFIDQPDVIKKIL